MAPRIVKKGLRHRAGRYYGDCRKYKKLGIVDRDEWPLVPTGGSMATTDAAAAATIYAAKLAEWDKELDALNQNRRPAVQRAPRVYAAQYVAHLSGAPAEHRNRQASIDQVSGFLDRLLSNTSFGTLDDIQKLDARFVRKVIREVADLPPLRRIPRTRTTPLHYVEPQEGDREFTQRLSSASQLRHMMALSGLVTYAISEGDFTGENPVAGHQELPTGTPTEETRWFEIPHVAALMDALKDGTGRSEYGYEAFASLVYTGARKCSAYALKPEDFDLEENEVIIDNMKAHLLSNGRKPKTRRVPLWPAYRRIMEDLAEREGFTLGVWNAHRTYCMPGRDLAQKVEQPMQSIIRVLRNAARRAGIPASHRVHENMGRHTYITARLSMLRPRAGGGEAPVSLHDVAREVGNSVGVLETTYAHVLKKKPLATMDLDYHEMARLLGELQVDAAKPPTRRSA